MKAGKREITCWGNWCNHDAGNGLRSVVQLTAGREHTCALKSSGHVVCWGLEDKNQCDVPDGLADVIQVQAGTFHTCALTRSGSVVCWGYNEYRQIEVPRGLKPARELAAGWGHTCALLAGSGGVECWGDERMAPPPGFPGLEALTQLTAGDGFTCGLKGNGSITCWGNESWGKIPPDLEPAGQIVAKGCNTCTIGNNTGGLRCWGCDSFSQTDVPPEFESGTLEVAVGYSNPDSYGLICALGRNSAVNCWGCNSEGQRDVQKGLKVAPPCPGMRITCAYHLSQLIGNIHIVLLDLKSGGG